MLSPVKAADPQLLNPPLQIRLGWLPFGLALLGLVSGILSRNKNKRAQAIFMGVMAVIFIFMSTSLSGFIWENLPLIEFVQFPWRFIGRAALPLAVLAGIPFSVLPELLRNKNLAAWITPLLAAITAVQAQG